MNQQLDLFTTSAVQTDEDRWEIYEGKKLIGIFECDGTRFEYFVTVGDWCGTGALMWATMEEHLQMAINFLKMRYRLIVRG